jgi:hypothetical protein
LRIPHLSKLLEAGVCNFLICLISRPDGDGVVFCRAGDQVRVDELVAAPASDRKTFSRFQEVPGYPDVVRVTVDIDSKMTRRFGACIEMFWAT